MDRNNDDYVRLKYARMMFARGYAMGKGYADADAVQFGRRFAEEPISTNEIASVVRFQEAYAVEQAAKVAENRREQGE